MRARARARVYIYIYIVDNSWAWGEHWIARKEGQAKLIRVDMPMRLGLVSRYLAGGIALGISLRVLSLVRPSNVRKKQKAKILLRAFIYGATLSARIIIMRFTARPEPRLMVRRVSQDARVSLTIKRRSSIRRVSSIKQISE